MARNRQRSFAKRKKEHERKERAAKKLARRRERSAAGSSTDEPDLDQVAQGPQPCDKPSDEEVRLAVERAMTPRNKSARQTRGGSFGARLFVGNLDAMVQEHELSALIAKAGFDATEVYIPRDRTTGESRGIAFVELTNARDAEPAIKALNGMSFHDKELRVNAAKARAR